MKNNGSRMNREVQVRFCEGLELKCSGQLTPSIIQFVQSLIH